MTQPAPTPSPGPKKGGKADKELLTRLLRTKLSDACPPSQLPMSLQNTIVPGGKALTYGDVVVHQLVDQAIQGREWAIEQVLDRTEGKPVQAIRQEEQDRSTHEKLNDVTTQLLNKFVAGKPTAKPTVASGGTSDPQTAPAGSPASRLLNLPKNGPSDPQVPQGESGVAGDDSGGG